MNQILSIVDGASDNEVDHALTALADPTRRSVVAQLGRGPRRASDLAVACNASRAAMSRHLKVLCRAGVIEVSLVADDGRGRRYTLRPDGLLPVQAWLDQVHAFWSEQLGSFAAHVQNSAPVDEGLS